MIRIHAPQPVRSYRDTPAYQRTQRPEMDATGSPTGRMVWPLRIAGTVVQPAERGVNHG